ncbi:MAG: T9SS type A sorting domain-containing protein [Bacteroidia bacterium]|nr:T9SS type A sorting domain-containing protein [Bacteroidia bacterium]
MRKLLLLSTALLTMYFGATAQEQKTASTPTVVTDTLHYYFNKFYFKTGISNINQYPYYKCPSATGTAVTHVGSKFEVPAGDSVYVTGLEAFVRKGPVNTFESTSATIKVGLYICNLNSSGMPVLPALDSVIVTLGVAQSYSMNLVGGNFANPRLMKNDYAVLFRNTSTTSGDSVRLMRTAGLTPTASAATGTNQCSDGGYGYVRFLGQFYSTRNFQFTPTFSWMPGFGNGTDYEWMVAPRVQYSIQASQQIPSQYVYLATDSVSQVDTACTRTVFTFTNTSSKFYEHRMYNLNHFYLKWALTGTFQAQPIAGNGFSADSAITWRFEAYDLKGEPERVFLPYVNTGTVSFVTDRPSTLDPPYFCYNANQFRARLRPMSIYGRVPMYIYDEDFKICLKFCNDDAEGINEVAGFENVRVYPNPAVNNKSVISGLSGKNTIMVYDLTGRLISTQNVSGYAATINLDGQPAGTYFVRINNSTHKTSVHTKVLKQD